MAARQQAIEQDLDFSRHAGEARSGTLRRPQVSPLLKIAPIRRRTVRLEFALPLALQYNVTARGPGVNQWERSPMQRGPNGYCPHRRCRRRRVGLPDRGARSVLARPRARRLGGGNRIRHGRRCGRDSRRATRPNRDRASVRALLAQDYPGALRVIVVDDNSTDNTGGMVRALAANAVRPVTVVTGAPLPAGWTGKLWAVRQGVDVAQASLGVGVTCCWSTPTLPARPTRCHASSPMRSATGWC